jgi:DMSO/TMAO reductase YedYZ molybdopterin-dependent catalytic subunit
MAKNIIRSKEKLAAFRKARLEGKKYEDGLPQGTGDANIHGMPQLPPGQREVEDWPVLDLGMTPEISNEQWRLKINGLIKNPIEYNWETFLQLPQVKDISDFHCVTSWSRFKNHWKGVRLSDIIEKAEIFPQVKHILFEGYDTDPSGVPYTTNIPLEEGLKSDVLLVYEWEGKPLPKEHGGPVRVITPQLYAWKGTKWVKTITFFEKDNPGFWEVRGYSNSAEPWLNDRYSY